MLIKRTNSPNEDAYPVFSHFICWEILGSDLDWYFKYCSNTQRKCLSASSVDTAEEKKVPKPFLTVSKVSDTSLKHVLNHIILYP